MSTSPSGGRDAECLVDEARVLYRKGALREALDKLHRALAICREVRDRQGEGATLTSLGRLHKESGQQLEALEHHRQALTIYRELHDRQGEGTALNDLGEVFLRLGRFQEALEHCGQALIIRREVRDRQAESTTVNNLGTAYYGLGRLQEALEHYRQALAIAREVGDRRGEQVILGNLDTLHQRLGRTEEAPGRSPMRQINAVHLNAICRLVCKKMGDVYTGPSVLLIEGGKQVVLVPGEKGTYRAKATEDGIAVFNEEGELLAEIEGATIDQPLPSQREAGIPEEDLMDLAEAAAAEELERAAALMQEGWNLFSQSRPGDALPLYDEALEICRKLGAWQGEWRILNYRGLAQAALGLHEEALSTFREAMAVHQELPGTADEATLLNNIGFVYCSMRQYEQALTYCERALLIHRKLGAHDHEELTLKTMAEALEALGRNEEARRCREEAALLGEGSGEAWAHSTGGGQRRRHRQPAHRLPLRAVQHQDRPVGGTASTPTGACRQTGSKKGEASAQLQETSGEETSSEESGD
jgi:tetratricopeptide (TPR) repeat protein